MNESNDVAGDAEQTDERRTKERRAQQERRSGRDRRQEQLAFEGPERRSGRDRRSGAPFDRRTGWDRRRGPGVRRSDDRRAAEEGEMTDEQFEFIKAIEAYKTANSRPFPTFTEVLEIAKALGYRKVAEPTPIDRLGRDE